MSLVQHIKKKFLREPASGNFQEFDVPPHLGSFSINQRIYETKLNKKYGIVLKDLINGKYTNFQGDLEKNVSFKEGYCHPLPKISDKILKKYEGVPEFCSMELDTIEELFEHIRKIHEISYSHYAWAKRTNLQGDFPNYCCGSSSRNVFLNLMEKGYPNSSFVSNSRQDHAYVALPFLLSEMKSKGFIVVDPTSDQLFNDKTNAPRNNLFVVFGNEWIYETDWNSGNNLYPSPEDESTFANLHTLRNQQGPFIYDKIGIEEYFEKVFLNPVKVRIDDI
jgi:hypothetical protein